VIGVVIPDPPPHAAPPHAREQDLGVDAVLVLLAQPVLGTAGAGPVPREADRVVGRWIGTRVQVRSALVDRLPFDEEAVGAAGEPDPSGSVVAVALFHPVRPDVGGELQVGIGGNAAVRSAHQTSITVRAKAIRR